MIRSLAAVPEHHLRLNDRCISAIGTFGTIIAVGVCDGRMRGHRYISIRWETGNVSHVVPGDMTTVGHVGR